MRQSVEPSASAYDSDIDVLLKRWGRWLRAGESGLSSIGRGGGIRDEEYRDVVAEMLDQIIAQLPSGEHSLQEAIKCYWLYEVRGSETRISGDWRIPRGRFKMILSSAIGWLCGSLASRIDAIPTLDNVERWEKRQQ